MAKSKGGADAVRNEYQGLLVKFGILDAEPVGTIDQGFGIKIPDPLHGSKLAERKARQVSEWPLPMGKEGLVEFAGICVENALARPHAGPHLGADKGPRLLAQAWRQKGESAVEMLRIIAADDPVALKQAELFDMKLKRIKKRLSNASIFFLCLGSFFVLLFGGLALTASGSGKVGEGSASKDRSMISTSAEGIISIAVRPETTAIGGDLSEYLSVFDGTYQVSHDNSVQVTCMVKVAARKPMPSAEGMDWKLKLTLLDSGGMPITGIAELSSGGEEYAKLSSLLKSGKGEAFVSFNTYDTTSIPALKGLAGKVAQFAVFSTGSAASTIAQPAASNPAPAKSTSSTAGNPARYVTVEFGDLGGGSGSYSTVVYDSQTRKLVRWTQSWDGLVINEAQLKAAGYSLYKGDFTGPTSITRIWDNNEGAYNFDPSDGSGGMALRMSGGATRTSPIECRLVSKSPSY